MQVGQRVEALETDGWASHGPHMPFQVPSPASRASFKVSLNVLLLDKVSSPGWLQNSKG